MNYDNMVSRLQTMLGISQNNEDIDFTRIIPDMFAYAEGRIYRELQFLATKGTQTAQLTANNRELALPRSVIYLDHMSVITPVGAITNSSTRSPPLQRILPEALDYLWPQSSYKPSVPTKYTIVGNLPVVASTALTIALSNPSYTIRLMPTPDKAYFVELYGGVRPTPLSPDNPETILTIIYPELFEACCMVFGTGYQRDYGAQADDPARAMSWETQYTNLRQGVMLEAAQLRGEGPGWTAATPAPAVQPRAP